MYEQCSMALNPVTHHDDESPVATIRSRVVVEKFGKLSSFEDVWHKGKISVFNYSVSHVAQIASNIKVARF